MDSPSEPISEEFDEQLSPINDELGHHPPPLSRHQEKKRPRDHRKSYTCSFKLKVVEHAEKYSNSKAADEFDVHRRRVQEWKNQKDRLVDQVKNYNGSTKRLKGGGRKLRLNQSGEASPKQSKPEKKPNKPISEVEIETYLTENLLDYSRKTDRRLTADVVLKEAKKINPKFKAGKEWAELFLEDFLINQPPPLKKRLDSSPPLAPKPQKQAKRQRRRFYDNSTVYRVGYGSPSPPLLSPRHYHHHHHRPRHHHDDNYPADDRHYYHHHDRSHRQYDDLFYRRRHRDDDEYRDEFLEKVEKDENNLVNHLEKWVQSFVDNYHASDPIDMRTLHKLVMEEAQKNAVVFTVTPDWVQEFLELNGDIYMSKCSMIPMSSTGKMNTFQNIDTAKYHDEDAHEMSGNYADRSDEVDVKMDVSGGNLVMAAFRNKSFGIHEWMDRYDDDKTD